uniref:Uncharacterized protein n=1 Tax=Anguilla anguilla TaxID=7936 RepID=A0A0E9RKY6_ANGAN
MSGIGCLSAGRQHPHQRIRLVFSRTKTSSLPSS